MSTNIYISLRKQGNTENGSNLETAFGVLQNGSNHEVVSMEY